MKIGNEDAKLYLGGSEVDKIYLGTEQVYGGSPSFSGKWIATYVGGTTSSAECDSSSAITKNEITLTNLTDVVIGDCVTSIGNQAFYECRSLTSVTISNSVTSIDASYAFYGCSSLTSVTIPDSVTNIAQGAFWNCSGLTSVEIGSGVTSIAIYAFRGCSGLTSITVNATTPPTIGTDIFFNTNNCPIYVPAESVETYKTANVWSTYASRIQAMP